MLIGKSTLDVLIGTTSARNNHCTLQPSGTATSQCGQARISSSSSGLGFRSRAVDRLRHARGSAIAIGAPVMNVV
eukprot:1282550-Prymnesium_polylepis.1